MKSQRADEGDSVATVSRLIEQFGVEGLVALIAEITEQQSDYLLLSGERQKAAQCMRDVRTLQRAAQMLRH
jgi:Tfp pilus assembly protein PilN